MKKKVLSIFIVMSMIFSMAVFAADGDNTPIVEVDGHRITFEDQQPVILEGENRTLVPARGVFEEMGAKVEWNAEKRLVTINSSNNVTRILITIDDPTMIVYKFTSIFSADKDEVLLDAAPRIINDRTMIPLRAISEALNAAVEWEGSTRTVSITTNEITGYYTPRPGQTANPDITDILTSTQKPSASPAATSSAKPTNSSSPSPSAGTSTGSGSTTSKNTPAPVSGLNNAEVYITSDKTSAKVGDIITVSFNIKGIKGVFGDNEGIIGVTASINYDNAVLEYVKDSIKYNTTASIISAENADIDVDNIKQIKLAGVFSDFSKAMKNEGMLVEMKFKVLSNSSTTLVLSDEYYAGFGYDTFLNYVKDGTRGAIKQDLKIDKTPVKIN